MKKSPILAALILGLAGLIAPVPASADQLLYSNGPGTVSSAYLISDGVAVTDSFTLSQDSTVTGADFTVWILDGANGPAETLSTVDYAITTAPLGGTTEASGTVSPVGSFFEYLDGDWYIYEESFSIPSLSLSAGTYWFELQNALPAPRSNFEVSWNDNNGPSAAVSSSYGSLNDYNGPGTNSEAFDIYGTVGTGNSATPEPSSFLLLASGLAGLAGMVKRALRA